MSKQCDANYLAQVRFNYALIAYAVPLFYHCLPIRSHGGARKEGKEGIRFSRFLCV